MNKTPKIVPRGKWVFVKPNGAKPKVSDNGLYTPSSVEREEPAIGEVLGVGKEISDIEKGDIVIYGAYAGEIVKFEVDGKEVKYMLLHDDDIIGFKK